MVVILGGIKLRRDQITNEDLYSRLLNVSRKIRERRMRVAEHCDRHKEKEALRLVLLWQKQQRQTIKRGRPRTHFA